MLDPCEFRDFRQLPNVVTHARFRGLASWLPHGRSGGETALRPRTWPTGSPRASSSRRDGHKVYLEAVEGANGAQSLTTRGLVKLYEGDSGQRQPEARYRPAQCLGTRRVCIAGDPDPHHLSTSFAERQNLSVRMGMRRFTGLTREVAQEHGGGAPASASSAEPTAVTLAVLREDISHDPTSRTPGASSTTSTPAPSRRGRSLSRTPGLVMSHPRTS